MTTWWPCRWCQSSRPGVGGEAGQVALGEVGDLVHLLHRQAPEQPGEQGLLGGVGRGPADQGAPEQAGATRGHGAATGQRPRTATRKGKTLPPWVKVPSKSKAATIRPRPGAPLTGGAHVPVTQRCPRRPAPRRSAGPLRASRRWRPRRPRRASLTAASPGRAPLLEADMRSERRQHWGRAASWRASAAPGAAVPGPRGWPGRRQGLGPDNGRPVRMRSMARPWPIRRGRRTVPRSNSGTPKRRQNTPKTASSAATRRSHHRASSRPPATA